ncbi:MAG: SH3 domain-containing protein [Clostridiales bacterium]|nr:SH3 domain-containing protein [Clostridiales bacterium]
MRVYHPGTLQKIAVAFLVLVLVSSGWPVAFGVQVASAPLSIQSGAVNGMVRVFLSSLGNPSTLGLTIAGNYSINGDPNLSIGNGESITVGFSSATGAITMTRSGVKTNMGTYFALRRHSAAGVNGIKIAQARVPGNPYPGDLSFQSVKQSNGSYKLYTIAHIYLENYLYGVLPYEMGNGAHIEALKAQAVGARTYTVEKMRTRASGLYDVVDTTNDQVYNGTPSGNANCVTAVDSTKGVVLKNGSSYTGTYYSASNGGQMESAANLWKSSGYEYLMVKDDPFDLANPDASVKRSTISADLTGGVANASLLALLQAKAITALNSAGYNATTANTALHTVKSITPHTPMYPAPSKLYTKMDFVLTASTRNKSGNQVTATVTVTCGIFTELESMLGMSIQSATNELWTVAKSGSNFVMEARRYGHGIGMSQRGAMQMGKMGYTYDQILGFYYNGCKRVRISFTNTILAAGSSQQETTVEDPADFEEEESSCTGVVKLVGSTASLAIRNGKSLSAAMLGVIANNSPVKIYANDGTWCFIGFGAIKGYVPANALTITGTAPVSTDETVSQISGFATVQANGYLNLRASGSSSAPVITTAPTGAILTILSKSGGWARVQFGATVAYASTDFLSFSSTYPGNVTSSGSLTATVFLEDSTASVHLRSAPSTSSGVLAQLPNGTTVSVTRDDGSWSTVVYHGVTGYIVSSCLKFEDGGLGNEPGGDTPGTQDPTVQTATVNDVSAYIRQDAIEASPSLLLVGMGQSVIVLSRGERWSQVRYEGVTGYMLTASLTFQDEGGSHGEGEAAIVNTQSGSLNLRREAMAGSAILTTIPKGTQITVTARGTSWSAVRYNGFVGYVMTSFLQFMDEGTNPQPTDPTGDRTATVATESGSLNLRAQARAGSAILRTIPKGARITVHQMGTEWSNVTYLGTTGYVMTVFLAFDEELEPTPTPLEPTPTPQEPTPTPEPTDPGDVEDPDEPLEPEDPDAETALYAVVSTVSGSLNLRQDILPGSAILAQIPKGTTIRITQKLAAWSQTTYAGRQGYVMNAYLTFVEGQPSVETGSTATVNTSSGSLNLRTEPSTSAGIRLRIPQYATVLVGQRGDTWSYVTYNGKFGYVMSAYLLFSTEPPASQTPAPVTPSPQTPPTATPAPEAQTTAWVSTSGGTLNLRKTASTSAAILAAIPNTTAVTLLQHGDQWCQVNHQGITGYVMTQFLRISQTPSTESNGNTDVNTVAETETVAWVNTLSGSLNLRESMSTSARILTQIPRLATVSVLGVTGTWSQIRYGGYQGYVISSYLTHTDPNAVVAAAAITESGSGASGDSSPDSDGSILDPTLMDVAQETFAWVSPGVDAGPVYLWPQCNQEGEPLAVLPGEVQVRVLQLGQNWCQVIYQDNVGYCLTDSLLIGEAGS